MVAQRRARSPLVAPAVVLGVGLGGFVDGIVLHQLLQWHHMLTAEGNYPSDTIAGLEVNTLWDGLFHVASWLAVLLGVVLMWARVRQPSAATGSWRTLAGGLAVGWGAFNLVEGIVDHHILTIHHVRDDVAEPLPWDVGFLAFGAVVLVVGIMLVRWDRRRVAEGAPGDPVARRPTVEATVSDPPSSTPGMRMRR
jgi:uncharacterized membrane protein